MFQFPAIVSMASDAFVVIIYFTDPGLFDDSFGSLNDNLRLGRSSFLLVGLGLFHLPLVSLCCSSLILC